MACGVPVICSRIEPLLEVAGNAALFVDPRDPENIGEAIVSVLEDAAARAELVEKGYQRAQEFTWEETAKRTLGFIDFVVGEKSRIALGKHAS